jgi:hypothetical protein
MLGKISRAKADGAAYNAEARRILASPNVKAMLEERGDKVRDTAGPGHRVTSKKIGDRWQVSVAAYSIDARVAEARNKTLSRALDAARTGKSKGAY